MFWSKAFSYYCEKLRMKKIKEARQEIKLMKGIIQEIVHKIYSLYEQ